MRGHLMAVGKTAPDLAGTAAWEQWVEQACGCVARVAFTTRQKPPRFAEVLGARHSLSGPAGEGWGEAGQPRHGGHTQRGIDSPHFSHRRG